MKEVDISSFFRKIFIFSMILITIISYPVKAINFAEITPPSVKYMENDILFYDENAGDCESSGDSAMIKGSKISEKIWSGLKSLKYKDYQAAAVMGNMKYEGGMNPVRHEISFHNSWKSGGKWVDRGLEKNSSISYGVGLIQWSYGRRVKLLKLLNGKIPDLVKKYILDPDKYNTSGDDFLKKAGQKDTDKLISLELEYLDKELRENSTYKEFFKKKDLNSATNFFLRRIEVPADPDGQESIRKSAAKSFLKEFKGHNYSTTTTEGSGSTKDLISIKDIFIIGDSITANSKNAIKGKFSGIREKQINTENGREWSEGLKVLKNQKGKVGKVLVFALGTNSSGLKKSDIDEVFKNIKNETKVVFVTNYTKSNNYDSNNNLMQKTITEGKNAIVVDWKNAVKGKESEFLSKDGINPNKKGQEKWAELLFDGINSNSNIDEEVTDECKDPNEGDGKFYKLLMEWAWPEYHKPPYSKQKPAYTKIVQERVKKNRYVGGNNGNDCGGWVSTLLSESGADPKYNSFGHARNNADWKRIGSHKSPKDLQPGDVAYTSGHTFIFVGSVPGFKSQIASASYDEHGMNGPDARSPMAGHEEIGGSTVWYRNSKLNKAAFNDGGMFPEGGMSFRAAKEMMRKYKKISNSEAVKKYNITVGCDGINIKNCTSFSAYFVAMYSGEKVGNICDGHCFVDRLASRLKLKTGYKPKPYAVFSTPGPSGFGHTGVVLAVNGNKVIIAEAGCSEKLSWTDARKMTMKEFMNRHGRPKFAYLERKK